MRSLVVLVLLGAACGGGQEEAPVAGIDALAFVQAVCGAAPVCPGTTTIEMAVEQTGRCSAGVCPFKTLLICHCGNGRLSNAFPVDSSTCDAIRQQWAAGDCH